MKAGEKALVLLPTESNTLLMQWKGPYQIVRKVGNVDYMLDVNGMIKTYHANLLKKYVERDEPEVIFLMSIINPEQIDDPESDDDLEEYVGVSSCVDSYTDVDINQDLDEVKIQMMKELFQSFSDVFTEQPGHTHVIQHDIRTTTDKAVRVSPRHIPFAMVDTVNEEVNKMLDIGVIEMSDSPYSSPIVLVARRDNTFRFCVDSQKLNSITVFDAEPMPDVDAMFAKLSGHKFFCRLDLSKGYWQVPLTQSSRPLTAFQTLQGLFQFTKM
jgi:hypothetical protein